MPQHRPVFHKPNIRSEEQGYLASVSDVMATLLFIFIITTMTFVLELQEATSRASKKEKELTDAREVRKELMEDIKKTLDKKGITVEIDTEKGLLHIPGDILFPSGQAHFPRGGTEEKHVRELGEALASLLPCYCVTKEPCKKEYLPGRFDAVLIEGHTDRVKISKTNPKFEDNWDLSAARSIATYRYLTKEFEALKNFKNTKGEHLLGVSAYEATRPRIEHNPDLNKGTPENRRIALRFILATPETEK